MDEYLIFTLFLVDVTIVVAMVSANLPKTGADSRISDRF